MDQPRRRAERPVRTGRTAMVALAGLALVGGLGTVAMWRSSSDAEARADRSLAELGAAAMRADVLGTMRAMEGASGLGIDGFVSAAEFGAYADDLFRGQAFTAVGLVRLVTDDQRAAFEDQVGTPIMARTDDGAGVVAPRRDRYWVLRFSAPDDGPGAALVGFDVGTDDMRVAAYDAAIATQAPSLSAPIVGLTSGAPSYLVVFPLTSPAGGPPDRFVIATTTIDRIVADTLTQLPPHTSLWLADGGQALTGDAPSGATARTTAGGRQWAVTASDGAGPDRSGAVALGIAATVGMSGLALQSRREIQARRRERLLAAQLAEDRARTEALAALARAVAVAGTPVEVAEAAAANAAAVLGARTTSIGRLDRTGRALDVVFAGQLEPGLTSGYARQPLDRPLPLVDAAVSGLRMVLADRTVIGARYPTILDDVAAAGIEAVAAVPLVDAAGRPIGAMGLSWSAPLVETPELASVLSAVADVCAQALARATLGELRQQRATGLAQLAQSLAGARTPTDVGHVVRHGVPDLFDAAGACVLVHRDGPDRLVPLTGDAGEPTDETRALPLVGGLHPSVDAYLDARHVAFDSPQGWHAAYPDRQGDAALEAGGHPDGVAPRALHAEPVRDAGGRAFGALTVTWARPTEFDAGLEAELATVADIVGQTLERAALYEAEHALVVSLQHRILRPLPTVEGLEVAARYVPATRNVNIGGDWYDVISVGERSTLVVGDVVGHGLDAISAMAELRSLVAGLVHAGTPLGEVLATATRMLDAADPIYATVQLVELDFGARTLRHVSAGHPPALLATGGTVRPLLGGRGQLIGAGGPPIEPATIALAPGSFVLAYTDGLVERRGETINDGIDRLAGMVGGLDLSRPLDGLVDEIVGLTHAPTANRDDVVVLAARVG